VVAVSQAMKRDVHDLYGVPHHRIRVIHNGRSIWSSTVRRSTSIYSGVRHRSGCPFVLFVGRITRQEGHHSPPSTRFASFVRARRSVLCAGAPDTPEIAAEMDAAVERARATKAANRIVWIREMLAKEKVIGCTHARRHLRVSLGL
jgi:hypothetical protein